MREPSGHRSTIRQLIQLCAQWQAGGGTDAVVAAEQLGRVQSWERLILEMARHGLGSSALLAAARAAAFRLPEPVEAQLNALHIAVTARNAQMADELRRIAEALEATGIRYAALKGPALAAQVYDNATTRKPGDLDLLVAPDQAVAADEVLKRAGYARTGDPAPLSERVADPARYHTSYRRAMPSGVAVDLELHWAAFPASKPLLPHFGGFDTRALLAASEAVRLAGGTVRTLSACNHLVFLLAHTAKHEWREASMLVDIARCMNRLTEQEWRAFSEHLRTGAGSRSVLGAVLAAEHLAAPCPAALLAELKKRTGIRFLRRVITARYIFALSDERLPRGVLHVLGALVSGWRTGTNRRALLRALLKPTDVDREWVHLPRALSVGYYAVRPVRLVSLVLRSGLRQRA